MERHRLAWSCAVSLFSALVACVPGNSGGRGSFSRGFAFIRDGGIYLLDDSDPASQPIALVTTGTCRNPSLSDDGRRVVYAQRNSELWIASTAKDAPPTQLPSGHPHEISTPIFFPGGDHIVFASHLGASSSLVRIKVDGTGDQVVTQQGYYTSPSFYPDGQRILAVKAAGSVPLPYTQLVRLDLAGGPERPVASLPLAQACAIAHRAILSPDGTKIAFDAWTMTPSGCSGPVRIFVMDLASQSVHRLTHYIAEPSASDGFPTWVGADVVAYSSNVGGGGNNVYSLDASLVDQSAGVPRVPNASEPYYGPN